MEANIIRCLILHYCPERNVKIASSSLRLGIKLCKAVTTEPQKAIVYRWVDVLLELQYQPDLELNPEPSDLKYSKLTLEVPKVTEYFIEILLMM